MHARALRSLLEQLDDLVQARKELVATVNRLVGSDDITPRILKAASGMEWVNVQPAMFEDILDAELTKYDKFRVQLEEDELHQGELLDAVKVKLSLMVIGRIKPLDITAYEIRNLQERHAEFARSRKEDASVKEREMALQSLDLAYHKYKEITRNLDEGLKVRPICLPPPCPALRHVLTH